MSAVEHASTDSRPATDGGAGTDASNAEICAAAERLVAWFPGSGTVTVAFSGGVDSALVLAAAMRACGAGRVRAVLADSPSLPRRELGEAQEIAALLGAPLEILLTHELSSPDYRKNDASRCYHCKSALYGAVLNRLMSSGSNAALIVDGTNADDGSDVRPGLRAANEARVRHPLAECGLTKRAVRDVSRLWGLPTWNKPEMACLASRVPHGTEVSEPKLALIEAAEAELLRCGFRGGRVRLHELPAAAGDVAFLARIELAPSDVIRAADPDMRTRLAGALRQLGFAFVTVDLEGYRRGGRVSDDRRSG